MARLDIGGSGYEIYGEEANYDLYLNTMPRSSAWAAVAAADKQNAIVAAARLLDRQAWLGEPVLPIVVSFDLVQPANTQGIAHPRSGLTDRNGFAILTTEVASDILLAAYEIAFTLSQPNPTIEEQEDAQKLKRTVRVVGPLRTENEYFERVGNDIMRFPQIVTELLAPYLDNGSFALSESFGATDCSHFSPDKFGLDDFGFK